MTALLLTVVAGPAGDAGDPSVSVPAGAAGEAPISVPARGVGPAIAP